MNPVLATYDPSFHQLDGGTVFRLVLLVGQVAALQLVVGLNKKKEYQGITRGTCR